MNNTVSTYMASIGSKGGSKRKHHPQKAALAKAAAKARWGKRKKR